MTVQRTVEPYAALDSAARREDTREKVFVPATTSLRESSDAAVHIYVPSGLPERYRALTYRIEKPDSILHSFAILSADTTLVDCSSLSHASDSLRAVRIGMGSWLRQLSNQINHMIWRRSSAALMLLAH